MVAPASPLPRETAARLEALLAERPDAAAVRVEVHPQCFLSEGHFAGGDAARLDAFLEVANDPAYDAVWFARGGYGSGRLVEPALPRLGPAARAKRYLGYSDLGALLGALYAAGFVGCAHGPMPQDLARTDGEVAVGRALDWLVAGSAATLEPSLATDPAPACAFNLTLLSTLVGTPWLPDLAGHVLMLEEVSEALYRIDRLFMHVTSAPAVRRAAGLRLGRCSDITPNTPEFGADAETIARFWCARAGIPYLGRADIGHDAANRVVPYGRALPAARGRL